MLLEISDTSVRLYRKRDGSASVRWHSYLMFHTKGQGFRLAEYLNQFDCSLTLDSGEYVLLDNYEFTYDCLYGMDHMIHEVWASGSTEVEVLKDTAGLLRIEYRLFSHPGQGSPDVIERVVPVLARGVTAQRYSSDPSKWGRS